MRNNEQPWRRPIEQPVVQEEGSPLGGTVETHPAYAQIVANRVSGGDGVLYGSDFRHPSYVSIKIASSRLHRSLSRDWPMSGLRGMVEVHLSEAQWARFVSSMNIGEGTQCTLDEFDGKTIPGIPAPADRRAQFASENAQHMSDAIENVNKALKLLEASGLSKTKQADIADALRKAVQDIGVNQDFVTESFDRHMEKTTERAKIEVDAYVQGSIRTVGLRAIEAAGLEPLVIKLPGTWDVA